MKKFFVTAIIVLVVLSAAAGFLFTVASKFLLLDVFLSLGPPAPLIEKTNILVLGLDNVFGQRSDTIMVLHVNPENKEAALLSIPRDTLAVLPGNGLDKINHAYTYGGIELARKTVENLLNIDIPYYVTANYSGITSLIDELGGITLDVEKEMYYVDRAGDLYIDLKPGIQKLTGKESLGYLRYRQDGGDLQRILRQQKFLRALAGEMMKRDNLLHSPKLFLNLLSYIDTNLDPKKSLGLSLGMRAAYELGKVHMATLPGTDLMVDGIYYWKPDETEIKNLIAPYLTEDKN